MLKKRYQTKNIYIGYITMLDPDAESIEGQVKKGVLALQKQGYNQVFVPLQEHYPYYSIDYVIPISKKLKRVSTFITKQEIDAIIQVEGKQDLKKQIEQKTIEIDQKIMENEKQLEWIKQREVEITNQKTKRLVA